MAGIADNLQAVRARLSRAPGVTLLAVSKTQSADRIREAFAAGQKAFGENYVQEAVQKMEGLPPSLEWHLIGPLQSNKTRIAAERFAWVQTVASEKIARRLSEQRPAHLPPLNVLIQVNVSGEASKSGVELDEGRRPRPARSRRCRAAIARADGDSRAGRRSLALRIR
jgi:pyridoxal phosphate enzyme (YggS family)